MIYPGRLDLRARRRVPFPYEIEVRGIDLMGAMVKSEIRTTPDAAGDPLATFTVVGVTMAASVGVAVSTITLLLGEPIVTNLPAAAEVGQPVSFAWDMLVTPAGGGVPYALLAGAFTVDAGVTING